MTLSLIGVTYANPGTTVTLPTHQAGDLIGIAAYRNSNTIASKPAASGTVPTWWDVDPKTGANTNSLRTAFAIATAANHTSGTWTNATDMAAFVVRSDTGRFPAVGGHAESGSTSTGGGNVAVPAIVLRRNDGSSLIVQMCFHLTLTTPSWGTTPAGYTQQAASWVTNGVCVLTKNTTTSDGAVNQPINGTGTANGYRAAQIEVYEPRPAPTNVNRAPVMRAALH